jgi:hypothetical protein
MPDTTHGRDTEIFSRRISLDDSAAFHGRIDATDVERARLCTLFHVDGLSAFHFNYRLAPLPSHRYRLTGDLIAEVTQACVLTLEPVTEHIKETVSVEFWPASQIAAADFAALETGLDDEFPEEIVDGKIDVGAFAAEILANAINPYPKKAGVGFEWDDQSASFESESSGPFAQLGKLRTDR